MPDVFERYFSHFGKSVADYYQLRRLDPSYRIVLSKTESIDIPAGIEALCQLFERLEPGSKNAFLQFLEEGKYKYEIGINELVYKPGLSLTELMDIKLVRGAIKMHIFQSISSYVRKFFKDARIIKLLEFPVLFLGAKPNSIPALYSLMNYADMALGTWYPMGGMYEVVKGMTDLAREKGVQFEFGHAVERFELDGAGAKGVVSGGKLHSFDAIVASADYHHVEQQLLPPQARRYSARYWSNRVMAPSSLIFYLGLNKKVKNLCHHTLFFDEDFALHAREIYDDPKWPTAPQFYVSCPSKTDSSVAPEGCENIFILIPVAPGLKDDEITREKYFQLVIKRFEMLIGESITDSIIYKRSYAHNDFIADYHAFKGNAYGLANTLLQTANLKPSMVSKKVNNLFYTGQLTVPGPGVPPSIISGQVVAEQVMKKALKSSIK
jgi:phytoene desaturase